MGRRLEEENNRLAVDGGGKLQFVIGLLPSGRRAAMETVSFQQHTALVREAMVPALVRRIGRNGSS